MPKVNANVAVKEVVATRLDPYYCRKLERKAARSRPPISKGEYVRRLIEADVAEK